MFSKKGWLLFISLLVILLLLSACSRAQQESLTPTMVNSTLPTPQILLPTTNTVKPPKIAPTQTLTPSLQPIANCPIPSSQAQILEAGTGAEAEQIILDYLNQGGSPEQLQIEINKLGTIVDSSQVVMVDTNLDGSEEIVLAINFAPPKSGAWEDMYGNLSIYSCVDGAYDVTKIAGENQDNFEILAVENLLKSENPEILVSRKLLYFNSCNEFVEMYSLAKRGWVSSFKTDESPCETKIELEDKSNGHKLLIIEGSRACLSISCGPTRGRKWTYEFQDSEVELLQDELLPSFYRIHTLEDGEIAIQKGDLDTAIEAYDKAARDNNLIDVLTRNEQDEQISQNIPLAQMQQTAHDYQTSFAYFREFVLLHYLNRKIEAENLFDQIKTFYPEGKSGNEFVDISLYFLDQIKNGVTVQEACEATNEYLAEKYILSANDFIYPHLNGWGDPQIGELLCPVVNPP